MSGWLNRGDVARASPRTALCPHVPAAKSACDLLVLPECSLAGWLSPSARKVAEQIPGPLIQRFVAAARKHKMAIVPGLEERDGTRVYNSAVFIDRHGEILARHRKINELEIGLEVYSKGASLNVFAFEGRTAYVEAVQACRPTHSNGR